MKLYRVICSLIQSVTRCLNAYASILERPQPKAEVEVLPNLPPEVQELLELARLNHKIKQDLPNYLRAMIDEEEREWAER
jgi:hypothetical protein